MPGREDREAARREDNKRYWSLKVTKWGFEWPARKVSKHNADGYFLSWSDFNMEILVLFAAMAAVGGIAISAG